MRIDVDGGPARRLLYGALSLAMRARLPDVLRTLWYRRERFGRPGLKAAQAIMRGPSEWTAGERELFAAFVSVRNQCPF